MKYVKCGHGKWMLAPAGEEVRLSALGWHLSRSEVNAAIKALDGNNNRPILILQ